LRLRISQVTGVKTEGAQPTNTTPVWFAKDPQAEKLNATDYFKHEFTVFQPLLMAAERVEPLLKLRRVLMSVIVLILSKK
jgi:hypothetical protein